MTDRKRRIEIPSTDSGDGNDKKNKQEINPWTNRPYSPRYYSILENVCNFRLPV